MELTLGASYYASFYILPKISLLFLCGPYDFPLFRLFTFCSRLPFLNFFSLSHPYFPSFPFSIYHPFSFLFLRPVILFYRFHSSFSFLCHLKIFKPPQLFIGFLLPNIISSLGGSMLSEDLKLAQHGSFLSVVLFLESLIREWHDSFLNLLIFCL